MVACAAIAAWQPEAIVRLRQRDRTFSPEERLSG
jgi:hypothetical protein